MTRSLGLKIACVVAGILFLNVAWLAYVRQEHTLYSWDYDNYWCMCGQYVHYGMTSSHMKFLRDVLGSIRDQQYTAVPVMPSALAIVLGEKLHLFSFSRAAYILANGNFYLVPALLLLIWLVACLQNNQFRPGFGAIKPSVWVAGALMALLTPTLWLPLLRGYPDGGGLVFCFLIMVLFARWHQEQRSKADDMVTWLAIVILLVGLVYFRRWYLYWILWFWIAAGMICLWEAWELKRAGSSWLTVAKRPAVLCAGIFVFAVLTLLASPHFVRELLFYNYADHYAAFKLSKTTRQFLANTFSSPGIVFILFFIGGLGYGFSIPHLRKLAVFQLVQSIGAVAEFGHTQDFSPQHHYLLLALMLPWTTLFVAVGLQKMQWRLALCLIPLGILVTTLSFTTWSQNIPAVIRPLIGIADGAPMTRDDLSEWLRLGETMDAVLLSHGYGQVYVLGASTTINSSALRAIDRSLDQKFDTPDFVDYSAEIDKRDGFPAELLHARYVIVADPVQINLAFDSAEQQIVAAPAREFLEGSGIAAAFEKVPGKFELDGGIMYTMDGGLKKNLPADKVEVYIYRKIQNLTAQEVEQLSRDLRLAHPARPYIYNPPAQIN